MSRFKIIFAGLALIASAGLVNCSEFQGNHNTPADGPALPSENPNGPSAEEQQAALEMQQKLEHRSTITTDLNEIASMNFSGEQCPENDQEALANQQEVVNTGSQTYTFAPPLERIMDSNQSAQQVQFAATALARSLSEADNHFCALNVAAQAANYAVTNLMAHPALDVITSEQYDIMVQKAESIRNALSPVVSNIQDQINADIRAPWIEMASEHESLRSQINESISALNQMVATIRASYQCDDTTGSCSANEMARGSAVVRTETIISQAQGALDQFQIQEPGDPRLTDARNEVLRNSLHELTIRVNVMGSIVEAIESEQIEQSSQPPVENYDATGEAF